MAAKALREEKTSPMSDRAAGKVAGDEALTERGSLEEAVVAAVAEATEVAEEAEAVEEDAADANLR